MKRRSFLKQTTFTVGALPLLPFQDLLSGGIKKKYANGIVTLGKTRIKVSRLAVVTHFEMMN
jgi:hypothetical protein